MSTTDRIQLIDDLEATFDRRWIVVAHVSELAGKGAFVTTTLGTEPIIVVRDGRGDLKAHLNTCRHRGSRLLEGSGTVKSIMCPYHGWLYSLDGELRGAPEMKYTECFDKKDYPLIGFPVVERAGFAMVAIRPEFSAPADLGLDPQHIAELTTAKSAGRWTSVADGRWHDVLADVAGMVSARWNPAGNGDTLVGENVSGDVTAALVLRPNLLLVAHSGAWTMVSVVPGRDRSTVVTGYCLVPEPEARANGGEPFPCGVGSEILDRSRAIAVSPSPEHSAPGRPSAAAPIRAWVQADRDAVRRA